MNTRSSSRSRGYLRLTGTGTKVLPGAASASPRAGREPPRIVSRSIGSGSGTRSVGRGRAVGLRSGSRTLTSPPTSPTDAGAPLGVSAPPAASLTRYISTSAVAMSSRAVRPSTGKADAPIDAPTGIDPCSSLVVGPLVERDDDPVGGVLGGLAVGVRQDDRELVAAVARADVAGSQGRSDLLGGPGQDAVAEQVAERVVHELEVVEVDHQQGQRRLRALSPDDLLAQPLVQVAVVEEAGQLVAVGEVPGILVVAGVLERHRGLVGHRPGELERRLVEDAVGPAHELDEADRAALGDERQHRRGGVPLGDGGRRPRPRPPSDRRRG